MTGVAQLAYSYILSTVMNRATGRRISTAVMKQQSWIVVERAEIVKMLKMKAKTCIGHLNYSTYPDVTLIFARSSFSVRIYSSQSRANTGESRNTSPCLPQSVGRKLI